MKNVSLLVWVSQLGLSVVAPLAGFTLTSVWLHNRYDMGIWVIFVGVIIGIICAVSGFRNSLKIMERMASDETKEQPPVSFNDHE